MRFWLVRWEVRGGGEIIWGGLTGVDKGLEACR